MLFIASDHAGLRLKDFIISYMQKKELEFSDLGVYDDASVDYPDMANLLCKEVLKDNKNRGILVCGSGIGMSIAANRHSGIRAALCTDSYMASMARRHNDANVLCLGERLLGYGVAQHILDIFLNESFDGGRHFGRVQKLS